MPPIQSRRDKRFQEFFDILGIDMATSDVDEATTTKPSGDQARSTREGHAVKRPLTVAQKLDVAPRAFISYRRAHSASARSLKLQLEKHGYADIFFDLDRTCGLKLGPFQEQLERALAQVDVVFVLLTPAPSGPKGDWRFELSSTETMRENHAHGRLDYCAREIECALVEKKMVVPLYPGRYGVTWIGEQMRNLAGLDALERLQSLNAYPLYDDMYEKSVQIVDSHVRDWLRQKHA